MAEKTYEKRYIEEMNRKNEEQEKQNLERFKAILEKFYRKWKAQGRSRKEMAEGFASIGVNFVQKYEKEELQTILKAKEKLDRLEKEHAENKKKLNEAIRENKAPLIKEHGYRNYVFEQQIIHNLAVYEAYSNHLSYYAKQEEMLDQYLFKLDPRGMERAATKAGLPLIRDTKTNRIVGIIYPGQKKVTVKL